MQILVGVDVALHRTLHNTAHATGLVEGFYRKYPPLFHNKSCQPTHFSILEVAVDPSYSFFFQRTWQKRLIWCLRLCGLLLVAY